MASRGAILVMARQLCRSAERAHKRRNSHWKKDVMGIFRLHKQLADNPTAGTPWRIAQAIDLAEKNRQVIQYLDIKYGNLQPADADIIRVKKSAALCGVDLSYLRPPEDAKVVEDDEYDPTFDPPLRDPVTGLKVTKLHARTVEEKQAHNDRIRRVQEEQDKLMERIKMRIELRTKNKELTNSKDMPPDDEYQTNLDMILSRHGDRISTYVQKSQEEREKFKEEQLALITARLKAAPPTNKQEKEFMEYRRLKLEAEIEAAQQKREYYEETTFQGQMEAQARRDAESASGTAPPSSPSPPTNPDDPDPFSSYSDDTKFNQDVMAKYREHKLRVLAKFEGGRKGEEDMSVSSSGGQQE
eukprot:gnl/Spiro4/3415_TR1661_c0_g1_i1.p1 gnl/Spiro4/3415_TR1661_c0_g1~~gnl/Spiro4/3415_TR1661_c0_g1_i1.p1  ORF type:complete len:357 (+),score=75.52 gnl/Spiro4/3415_TR1661_c0_g1_i1:80-1150(+)